MKPIIVIENCEDTISPWLLLEYRHASMIYGKEYLLFTNIPRKYHRLMSKLGSVLEESIVELVNTGRVDPGELIVLDPRSRERLSRDILLSTRYVVIGGILGDHPPRGRTYMYITSRLPSDTRAYNIGEGQYSIDGSVYYVNYLLSHSDLSEFRYIDGVSVETEYGHIYLPYRYPIVDDKPLLADGLEYYLKYRKLRDDIWREITGDP